MEIKPEDIDKIGEFLFWAAVPTFILVFLLVFRLSRKYATSIRIISSVSLGFAFTILMFSVSYTLFTRDGLAPGFSPNSILSGSLMDDIPLLPVSIAFCLGVLSIWLLLKERSRSSSSD
jgi:hypothetical protein